MKYRKIVKGTFLSRPNRFISHVLIDGAEHIAHVKNTGRCKELLIPGVTVYLYESDSESRKTKYDLVAVEKPRDGKQPLLINMDSQAPNDVAMELLSSGAIFDGITDIKREFTIGKSRFDFRIEQGDKVTFLEVKGCTLEKDGIARFPDAPTERGVKHIEELTELCEKGFGAALLIIIQMKEITEFRPNDETHAEFGEALRKASKAGVEIFAYDCNVTPDSLTFDAPVRVNLDP